MGVFSMKKVIVFIAFLLLAVLPKLIHPNEFFKSLFSSISGTPSILKGYNPFIIGVSWGASLTDFFVTSLRSKRSATLPQKSFSTIIQGLGHINKIM